MSECCGPIHAEEGAAYYCPHGYRPDEDTPWEEWCGLCRIGQDMYDDRVMEMRAERRKEREWDSD